MAIRSALPLATNGTQELQKYYINEKFVFN